MARLLNTTPIRLLTAKAGQLSQVTLPHAPINDVIKASTKAELTSCVLVNSNAPKWTAGL